MRGEESCPMKKEECQKENNCCKPMGCPYLRCHKMMMKNRMMGMCHPHMGMGMGMHGCPMRMCPMRFFFPILLVVGTILSFTNSECKFLQGVMSTLSVVFLILIHVHVFKKRRRHMMKRMMKMHGKCPMKGMNKCGMSKCGMNKFFPNLPEGHPPIHPMMMMKMCSMGMCNPEMMKECCPMKKKCCPMKKECCPMKKECCPKEKKCCPKEFCEKKDEEEEKKEL